MQFQPKKHVVFLLVNIIVIFSMLGFWLIYRMFVDNIALAG